MSWTCQCAFTNGDGAKFCSRCGQTYDPERVFVPAAGEAGSWKCQCTFTNGIGAKFCSWCGEKFDPARVSAPPEAPVPEQATMAAWGVQPPAMQTAAIQPRSAPPAASSSKAWMLGAIAGVMLLGAVVGTVVAVTVFGVGGTQATTHAGTRETVQTSQNPVAKPGFKEAFEASFKTSCRQSAMSSGRVSQSMADSYCECALSVMSETHSMFKAVSTCKQKIGR